MLLGLKTELKVNNKQRTALAQHAGTARHAWNQGLALTQAVLDHNMQAPEDPIKFPSAICLHKWLVASVKPENPWYYEVSKCAPQYALRQLSEAWKRCFQKVSKPPRFKRKGRRDSFTLDGSIQLLSSNKIKVPRIGELRTYERLPLDVQPKNVTISRQADRWLISFKIETETIDTYKLHPVVGVDLGVKTLATLSTGDRVEGAKSYHQLEQKLKRLQYRNGHKVMRSNNWQKAQVKIARLHRRIANIRKDVLHKLTSYLAKNHSQIVIEDLNVKGMLANHKLAKAVQDMGFYEFRRQLEYKCQLYSSELLIADRWFPSSKTCSNCGIKKDSLSLSSRTFECESCGFSLDRDLNAAINLAVRPRVVSRRLRTRTKRAALADSQSVTACGVRSADTSR